MPVLPMAILGQLGLDPLKALGNLCHTLFSAGSVQCAQIYKLLLGRHAIPFHCGRKTQVRRGLVNLTSVFLKNVLGVRLKISASALLFRRNHAVE